MQFPTKNAVWPVEELIEDDFFSKVKGCEIYTLDNGIRVLVMSDPNDRSTYLNMMVNAGAIHQASDNRGIAHFTEHMLFQGTELFSDWGKFIEHAEEYNLNWNGSTGDSNQEFFVEADNDDESINEAFIHLAELIWKAQIPEDKVEKEKQVVMSEFKAGMSDPDKFTFKVLLDHFYDADMPWSNGGVIGNEESINGFTHKSSLEFYKKYFHPQNMVLLVVGGKEIDYYKKLIEQYFNVNAEQRDWDVNPTLDMQRKGGNLITEVEKDFNHVNLYAGYYLHKPSDIDYPSLEMYALRFAAYALSTRVFLDLRDKQGLAYSIGTGLDNYDLGYFFNFSGEFPKEKYSEARKGMEDYTQNKIFEPITQVEFKRALRYYKSVRWAKSGRQVANHAVSNLFFHGQPLAPESNHKYLDQLTVDFVNETVNKFFKDRPMEVIAVGPLGG